MNTATYILFAILSTTFMGIQPIISSIGYSSGMNAQDITAVRYLTSGLIMLPYVIWAMRKGVSIKWPQMLLLAVFSGPLYSLVLIGGLVWAPASHSAIIFPALTPVFALLFAILFIGKEERFSFLGLTLLILGVLVIGIENMSGNSAHSHTSYWIGDLFFVTAAIMWALYIVFLRKWQANPLFVAAFVQVLGLFYVPVYFLMNGLTLSNVNTNDIVIQIVYQGVIISIITVILFNTAVRSLGAKAAAFMAIVPVVGVISSMVILGEPGSPSIVLGVILTAFGLVLSVYKKKPLQNKAYNTS